MCVLYAKMIIEVIIDLNGINRKTLCVDIKESISLPQDNLKCIYCKKELSRHINK